jgi:hypothetical protein
MNEFMPEQFNDISELSYNQLFYFSEWVLEYVAVIFDYEFAQLDIAAFTWAVNQLIERHEILRTIFVRIDGKIKQKALSASELDFEVAMQETIVRDNEMNSIFKAERLTKFNISIPRFFFVKIYKLEKGSYKVLFTMHHAITDSYSAGIFKYEIAELYAEALGKTSSKLGSLPAQYRDFSSWQRNFLNSPDGIRHREYWQARLSGFIPEAKFPSCPHLNKDTNDSCIFSQRVIDGEFYEEINRVLKKNIITRASLLMGVLFLMLSLLNDQEDITILVAASERDSKHYDSLNVRALIGCFANALFIRNLIKKGQTAIEYLKEVQNNFLTDLSFASYPIGKLIGELPNIIPTTAFLESIVYYNYHNYGYLKELIYTAEELERDGKKASIEPGRCIFGLVVFEFKNCLKLSYRLKQDVFDEVQAIKINDLYFSILKRVIKNPQLLIKQLSDPEKL